MSIIGYFQGAVRELHNVTWPTRRKAFFSAVWVLGFVAVAAVILGFADYGLKILFDALRSL